MVLDIAWQFRINIRKLWLNTHLFEEWQQQIKDFLSCRDNFTKQIMFDLNIYLQQLSLYRFVRYQQHDINIFNFGYNFPPVLFTFSTKLSNFAFWKYEWVKSITDKCSKCSSINRNPSWPTITYCNCPWQSPKILRIMAIHYFCSIRWPRPTTTTTVISKMWKLPLILHRKTPNCDHRS